MTPSFVLTNDCDHASTEHTGRAFEVLNRFGVKVTTAVFCVVKDSPCQLGRHCSPGETASLADPEFRKLMLDQQARGHEIAYHGYCQIGETREEFDAGLEDFRALFGEYPYTYIEHGPNPKTHPNDQHKPNLLAAEGKSPDSPYYILDLLREKSRVVWTQEDLLGTHHLTDPTGPILKKPVQFFRRLEDGLVHFHRYRLYLISHDPFYSALREEDASFVAYTHFGYPYPGEWGRWIAERWDLLDSANAVFWELVSQTGLTFKTLKAFHLEDARGECVPGRYPDRAGASPPMMEESEASKPEEFTGDMFLNPLRDGQIAISKEKGETRSIPKILQSPLLELADPLETLDLGIQGSQMIIQEKFLEKEKLLYWGMQIQIMDRLLQGCRTVLSIGEGDGRLLVPLTKRHGFDLTVVDPDFEGYEDLLEKLQCNLRLFGVEDRCRIERVSFKEYEAPHLFDAVVSMGMALDDCWKGGSADISGCLAKAHGLTRKVMITELLRPIGKPDFRNLEMDSSRYFNWSMKESCAAAEISVSASASPS